LDQRLDEKPLAQWAEFRWPELVLSIHWLYRRTGETWLLDLATKAKGQGFDWQGHFAAFPFKEKLKREDTSLASHVVNNAMAIKASGVWSMQSGDPADRAAVYAMIEALDR